MGRWDGGTVGQIAGRALVAAFVLVPACGGDRPDPVAQVQQLADSADQVMIGLTIQITSQGVRQAYLEADTAFVYETRGFTELKTVRITFYTTNGVQTSVLTSREGTYHMRTGAMEARGDVVVVRTDGARLTTSVLRFDQQRNEVSTDQPFVYDGADRHIEGEGFTSDPSFSNIVTRRPRGAAGRFTLPGQ
ncbi:MAG TPA: LPS export ABC transporter periplasmic protein LptC [Gemmatimonadales bacterium]|nr:LPS export ABC transporter periplasmic protein LptC [Gemmatimonadales bacterium]